LYWCDPGIVRAIKRTRGTLAPEEHGALFEGLVAQIIRACRDYYAICDAIYYWASAQRGGAEVDFLLAREGELIAVECKSGTLFHDTWCRGLRAASGLPGLRRRIVVYPEGPSLMTSDGIEVLPLRAFCDLLSNSALWD
jgi:predicted AAA+ superfamily ATPase